MTRGDGFCARTCENRDSTCAVSSQQADTTHPLTKHRKIASSFRDSSLFDIFTLSCNLLKQVPVVAPTRWRSSGGSHRGGPDPPPPRGL